MNRLAKHAAFFDVWQRPASGDVLKQIAWHMTLGEAVRCAQHASPRGYIARQGKQP